MAIVCSAGRSPLESELVVRGLVVLAVVVGVLIIARVRPSRRPAALSISGNLEGPGVFLFTSEQCDSCSAARDVYRTVLGEGGFVEHSWDSDSALLTRLGVQEIPVGTVIDSEGIEIASFRLVPRPGALARAVRKMHR